MQITQPRMLTSLVVSVSFCMGIFSFPSQQTRGSCTCRQCSVAVPGTQTFSHGVTAAEFSQPGSRNRYKAIFCARAPSSNFTNCPNHFLYSRSNLFFCLGTQSQITSHTWQSCLIGLPYSGSILRIWLWPWQFLGAMASYLGEHPSVWELCHNQIQVLHFWQKHH